MGRSLPYRDARVLLVTFARRPECETHRALNSDWWVTPEAQLLRAIEYGTRVGAWMQSADAQKKRNFPEQLPLTEAERFAAKPESERYDLHTLEEIDKLIGW